MDKTELDEIRDYTARECLTDSEWAALLSLAYEAVAAQERINGWKREFEKVQAKRDAYREHEECVSVEAHGRVVATLTAERDALRAALELCEAERGWFAELTEIYRKAWQENHNALVRLRELAEPLSFEEMNMPVAEMYARREALGGKS